MNVETLYDLFVFELQRVHFLEIELVDALGELATESTVDSLDDLPDSEVHEAAHDLYSAHQGRATERVERLERAFDALDHLAAERTREAPALDGLLEEKERFNNVVLNDALRNLFYLTVAISAQQLVAQSYEGALDLVGRLDVDSAVTDELESNRDDVDGALEDLRDLKESSEVESLLDELATRTPQD